MSTARILVVEDEAIVARDLCLQLKEMGYDPVGTRVRGEEAVAAVVSLSPDLILMDVNLGPGMDGIAAARIIRDLHNLPVIFLTAYASDEMIDRAKHSEPFGYLIKPFDERMLRSEIEIALYKHKTDQRLRIQSAALEAAANEILITDRDGRIVWANSSFSRYTGYALNEAIGKSPGELVKSGIHDHAFYKEMWDTILSGKPWRGQMVNRRKNGTHFSEDVTITPVVSERGISHFVAVKQDITERLSLEAQVQKAQRMEALGELSAGIAHDFNNILAATLLYIGLLTDEPGMADSAKGVLRELEKEVQRGSSLTKQLLSFGRQKTGKLSVLDLWDLIAGMQRMLQRLLGERVRVRVDMPGKGLWVHADGAMIEQVIINLCINARDAMPEGGTLTISGRLVEVPAPLSQYDGKEGWFVELSVKDTGCGMSEDVRSRIFEPFFTTKEAGRGTGLGLAIVSRILRQHKGWISVESSLGNGSSFSLFLPHSAPSTEEEEKKETPASRGRGERILLLEDEPSLREAMSRALREGGYTVAAFATIPAARLHLSSANIPYALLLADHVLPDGGDGVQFAQEMRAQFKAIRVIICSGYPDEPGRASTPPDPAFTYVAKPFTAGQLLSAVRQQLGLSEMAGAPSP
jgi:PAS domain S-box-containing protein